MDRSEMEWDGWTIEKRDTNAPALRNKALEAHVMGKAVCTDTNYARRLNLPMIKMFYVKKRQIPERIRRSKQSGGRRYVKNRWILIYRKRLILYLQI